MCVKILHIAHSNGGTVQGRFVEALAAAQRHLGHEVKLAVQKNQGAGEHVWECPLPEQDWEKKLIKRQEQQGFYDLYPPQLLPLLTRPEFLEADLVHLHDLQGGYFSHLLLPFLAAKPLVWTLYDERAFVEAPPVEGGRAASFRQVVRDLQGISEYTVAATQPWLKERVRRSPLGQHPLFEIPLGIDGEFWSPGDKTEARQQLHLPLEPRLVLVDAQAKRAVELLRKQGWMVLTLDQEMDQAYTLHSSELGKEGIRNLYRALDLYVCFASQQGMEQALEAVACGAPLAVPSSCQWQYPWLTDQESGVVLSMQSREAVERLKQLQEKPQELSVWGAEGRRRLLSGPWELRRVVQQYEAIYRRQAAGPSAMQNVPAAPASPVSDEALLQGLFQRHLDGARMKLLEAQGWPAVWEELKQRSEGFSKEEESKKGAYIDTFLIYCLTQGGEPPLWDVVEQWLRLRKMPSRSGHLKDDERLAALFFAREMREAWKQFLLKTPQAALAKVDVIRQSRMVSFWRQMFLNDAAVLYLDEGRNETVLPLRYRSIPQEAYSGKAYPDLLLRSMYQPYGEVGLTLDMEMLLKSSVPLALKVIAPFWLSTAPYYNNDKKVQQAALRHIYNYCDAAMKHPNTMPKGLFDACAEHFTLHLWRLSYSGGDMHEEIAKFGDFLQFYMKRFYPRWAKIKRKNRKKGAKLRVGYISSNFRNQAVSFYMVNRMLYVDKEKFELVTFSLERNRDNMTERIMEVSDRYVPITDFQDIDAMAEAIVESNLDLLIYTDIGMDPLTYKLAAMQLAPVQAVLVGHGVTTGLATIQYYLSGDFESEEADAHYRENLIRLSQLGAAQYAPFDPEEGRTRKDFGLPDDKVLFVSCANGIKHGPARDKILIEILKQAPNACVVLKPFMNGSLVDLRFVERLTVLAKEAGVTDRLRILPPLPKNTDLLALLKVCDVNLDTFPYGGWTTNMDAVYVGLPVVTQEGRMARTRWGAGMLRAMGIQEGIAHNEEEYVAWAVRFAKDEAMRVRVRAQIENKAKEILFSGTGTQREYEMILEKIVASAGRHNKK